MAGSTGTGIHSGRVIEPAVLPAAEAVAPPAPDSGESPNTAVLRPLSGGILEIGFAPGSILTPSLLEQVAATGTATVAAAAEPQWVPMHLLIDVSALDGVDPRAACVLGTFSGIGRIAFLGSGPADRVTARFVASGLPSGTDFRYVQDRDEALRYLERNG
ncbi:hypothetical protein GCM10023081_08050 [Arthrobacter ginkgonis]|uniref:STAS/SEC14 domain-containing protein n=1 Tax=Arthrobacter ginkgonis TaxID=1630594 RepID=A0ABP7BWR0_9MICC